MKRNAINRLQREGTTNVPSTIFITSPKSSTYPTSLDQYNQKIKALPYNSPIVKSTYKSIEESSKIYEPTEIVRVVWPQPLLLKRSDPDQPQARSLDAVTESVVTQMDVPAEHVEIDVDEYQDEAQTISRLDRLVRDLKVERELENTLNRMRKEIESEIVIQRVGRNPETFTTLNLPDIHTDGESDTYLYDDNRKKEQQRTNQQFLNQDLQNFQ